MSANRTRQFDHDEIAKLIQEGNTAAEISRLVGCNPEIARRVAKTKNLQMTVYISASREGKQRKPSYYRRQSCERYGLRKYDHEKVRSWILRGVPAPMIEQATNVPAASVYQIARIYGLKLASGGLDSEVNAKGRVCLGPCGEFKSWEDFYIHPNGTSGRAGWCIRCEAWKTRLRGLRQKYKIGRDDKSTAKAYEAMLDLQGWTCAIRGCDIKENPNWEWEGRILVVDHDHECCPGSSTCGHCVRGLLCNGHNAGATGDFTNLEKRYEYLRHFKLGGTLVQCTQAVR